MNSSANETYKVTNYLQLAGRDFNEAERELNSCLIVFVREQIRVEQESVLGNEKFSFNLI